MKSHHYMFFWKTTLHFPVGVWYVYMTYGVVVRSVQSSSWSRLLAFQVVEKSEASRGVKWHAKKRAERGSRTTFLSLSYIVLSFLVVTEIKCEKIITFSNQRHAIVNSTQAPALLVSRFHAAISTHCLRLLPSREDMVGKKWKVNII